MGFIGAGAIGLPMATRVAAAGHELCVVDASEERRELAVAAGMAASERMAALAGSHVAIVMVATAAQLEAALSGPGGALEHLRPGSTCVVMSTVGPRAVQGAARAAAARSVRLVDVPVTGGVSGAERGELILFGSGDPSSLDEVAGVLAPMGRLVRCGAEVGLGQSMKVVNQLLASVHLAAAAEALAFAAALDLDQDFVLDVMRGGAGGSWMLSDRGPRMLEGPDAEVTSAIDLFVKDSGLVTQAAADVAFRAPLVAAAHDAFSRAAERGFGRADDSQVIQAYGDPAE